MGFESMPMAQGDNREGEKDAMAELDNITKQLGIKNKPSESSVNEEVLAKLAAETVSLESEVEAQPMAGEKDIFADPIDPDSQLGRLYKRSNELGLRELKLDDEIFSEFESFLSKLKNEKTNQGLPAHTFVNGFGERWIYDKLKGAAKTDDMQTLFDIFGGSSKIPADFEAIDKMQDFLLAHPKMAELSQATEEWKKAKEEFDAAKSE